VRLAAAALAAALPLVSGAPAFAQAERAPIRIVGFAAGGTIDTVARVIAEHMKDDLGATVIVDSRPGAGGQIAAQALKQAAPDGRTLLLSPDHTMVMLPLTIRTPGFQPLAEIAAGRRRSATSSSRISPARSASWRCSAPSALPGSPTSPPSPSRAMPVDWEYWLGLFAPAKTPSAEVQRINAALGRALARPRCASGC
jgi:tripartite-type tricarboxylate transporter receptor subunit TctC